jgi:hypothetical protein
MKPLGELHTGEAKLDAQPLYRGDAHHTVELLSGERLGIGVCCTLNRLVTASAPLVRLCGARGDDAHLAASQGAATTRSWSPATPIAFERSSL